MAAALAREPQRGMGGGWPEKARRWRWAVLPLATAIAAAGFWGAAGDGDRWSGVGACALPLYWLAGFLLSWWAMPSPPIALAAAIAITAQTETAANDYAWMNYVGGLLLCEAAIAWGALYRRGSQPRAPGPTPERPRP